MKSYKRIFTDKKISVNLFASYKLRNNCLTAGDREGGEQEWKIFENKGLEAKISHQVAHNAQLRNFHLLSFQRGFARPFAVESLEAGFHVRAGGHGEIFTRSLPEFYFSLEKSPEPQRWFYR